MGIGRGSARLLLDEARRSPFSGELLELGKMFVFMRPRELARWARRHEVQLATGVEMELSHDPVLAAHGCMDDRTFFRSLGFDRVLSCDASAWEGADLLHDLNQPLPDELHGRFDAVFEGGTLQHVFHLPQVMRNIFDLLAPGGRMIHGMIPSSNHLDHGFYMFSPTLFYDWYTANGWTLEAFYLCEYVAFWIDGRLETSRWKIYAYEPGYLDHLSYGRAGNRQLGLFIVATKGPNATGDIIPQQGYYRELWDTHENTPTQPAKPGRLPLPLAVPWKLTRELLRRWGPKKMPPLIAKY